MISPLEGSVPFLSYLNGGAKAQCRFIGIMVPLTLVVFQQYAGIVPPDHIVICDRYFSSAARRIDNIFRYGKARDVARQSMHNIYPCLYGRTKMADAHTQVALVNVIRTHAD